MKTQTPIGLQTSDFQRWLVKTQGFKLDEAVEFCRAGNRELYVKFFNAWQTAKREPQ